MVVCYDFIMDKQQNPYVTTAQAADMLGVSAQRVRDLIQAGRIHAVKLGRDWAVSLKSVQEFERGKPWQFTDKGGTST